MFTIIWLLYLEKGIAGEDSTLINLWLYSNSFETQVYVPFLFLSDVLNPVLRVVPLYLLLD